VTISYLYQPPVTWEQVNRAVTHDDGPAKILHVLPTAQFPRWVVRVVQVLIFIGAVAVVYALIEAVRFALYHRVPIVPV